MRLPPRPSTAPTDASTLAAHRDEGGAEMLIVGGWFEVEPSERDAFVAARLDSVRSSRAEQGCIEYTVAPDPADPGRVILFERWEDQASLDAHLAGMQSAPQREGSAVAPTAVSVVVYEVSAERTLV